MQSMTTKERIVDEALSLFSIKGYKGTSVKDIADAVGIKDSSLYKHFKSKQEILGTIVETMRQHISEMSNTLGLPPDGELEKAVEVYATYNEDTMVEFSRKIFLFYLKDPFVSRFWRMGNMEQFQNSEVYAVFHKLFLEDGLAYQTALFAVMSKKGIFIDEDPQVIAMSFYAPIFFLLSKYANDTEHEASAVELLDRQIRALYRMYRRK